MFSQLHRSTAIRHNVVYMSRACVHAWTHCVRMYVCVRVLIRTREDPHRRDPNFFFRLLPMRERADRSSCLANFSNSSNREIMVPSPPQTPPSLAADNNRELATSRKLLRSVAGRFFLDKNYMRVCPSRVHRIEFFCARPPATSP